MSCPFQKQVVDGKIYPCVPFQLLPRLLPQQTPLPPQPTTSPAATITTATTTVAQSLTCYPYVSGRQRHFEHEENVIPIIQSTIPGHGFKNGLNFIYWSEWITSTFTIIAVLLGTPPILPFDRWWICSLRLKSLGLIGRCKYATTISPPMRILENEVVNTQRKIVAGNDTVHGRNGWLR